MSCSLIVADAEVLDLAVAQVAARHDVELARDAARDVLRVQLRLASVDLLEPVLPTHPHTHTMKPHTAQKRHTHTQHTTWLSACVAGHAAQRLARHTRHVAVLHAALSSPLYA
jgi:hypothetical protein